MSTPALIAGLNVWLTHPAQDPAALVVLLHGFGAPGNDLVAMAHELRGAGPTRYAMPEAPIELGGLYGDSRAWWRLDLEELERDIASGRPRDRRSEIPEGLSDARRKVNALLDALIVQYKPTKVILGGFSQGAMLALDAALYRDKRPDGLILMSGTLLNSTAWQKRMPKLKGCPIVMSHGRRDQLLPFAIAEQLSDLLSDAGADVTWVPFSGGHEIPPPVIGAVDDLLG
ncbi:MAG: alpha/beta fold hydrolase [Kofleriaceae bacterium]|nr:alpha/beta fold hydrolase [Kofleriaceae bacterium]